MLNVALDDQLLAALRQADEEGTYLTAMKLAERLGPAYAHPALREQMEERLVALSDRVEANKLLTGNGPTISCYRLVAPLTAP